MIKVLQTCALPTWPRRLKNMADSLVAISHVKAGEGTRTLDLLLGKEVFYQLNYTRM